MDVTPYTPKEERLIKTLKIIGFSLLACIFITIKIFSCNRFYLDNFRKDQYNIIVFKKYRQKENRDRPVISDSTGNLVDALDLGNCFDLADKGDTLLKKSGSLLVYLKKKDTSYIFHPYDTVSVW
jgi:hypothetical protein